MFIQSRTIRSHILSNFFRSASKLQEQRTRYFRGFLTYREKLRITSAIFLFCVNRLTTCLLGVNRRAACLFKVLTHSVNFTGFRRIICVIAYVGRRTTSDKVHRLVIKRNSQTRIRTSRLLSVFRLLIRQ